MPRTGRPQLYPWETWLNGDRQLLREGVDFAHNVNLESLRQQIYAAARQRGKRCSVVMYGDGGLAIQADYRQGAPKTGRPGRPEAYDWARIFDGDVHEMRAGVHFPRGGLENFRTTVRAAARRHKMKIMTRSIGRDMLMIRCETPKTPPAILFDEGIDEDSVFVAGEWEDSNV